MHWLRPTRSTAALAVALVALFCAMGGPAAAVTGGNFILGKTNTADHQTALTSNAPGSPALGLQNTATTTGSVPLKLTTSPGIAPFQTNSATKVNHLNADLLDGLDSTAYQKLVTGTCSGASAISAIHGNGTVDCAGPSKLLEGTVDDGPLPLTNVQSFTVPAESILLVTFTATGFRNAVDGPGMVGSALWLCKSAPCGPATATDGTVAQIFANQTGVHIGSAATAEMELLPGDYTIGLSPDAQTQTDANDRFSWSVVSFPL